MSGAQQGLNPKEIRTGQVLNVVATAGGLHAAYLTGRDIKRTVKNQPGSNVGKPGKVVGRIGRVKGLKVLVKDPKKAALASLGGWGVLHSAELAGDMIAARSLHHQSKQIKKGALMELVEPTEVAKHLITDAGNGHGTSLVSKGRTRVLSEAVEDFAAGRAARSTRILEPKNPYWSHTQKLRKPKNSYEAMGMDSRAALAGYHSNKIAAGTAGVAGTGVLAARRNKKVSKAWKGEPGDKRNTKYAGAAVAGLPLLGPLGAAGAAGGYAVYRRGSYPGKKRRRESIAAAKREKALEKVGKARRFDPEADRQRRLGMYAGLAGGGAIVTGDQLRQLRQVDPPIEGSPAVKRSPGVKEAKAVEPRGRMIGFKANKGKQGLALTAATAGLLGVSGASVKRGVSERNKTWT